MNEAINILRQESLPLVVALEAHPWLQLVILLCHMKFPSVFYEEILMSRRGINHFLGNLLRSRCLDVGLGMHDQIVVQQLPQCLGRLVGQSLRSDT